MAIQPSESKQAKEKRETQKAKKKIGEDNIQNTENTDTFYGIHNWPSTDIGETVTFKCGNGNNNNLTRMCLSSGVWNSPSYHNCIDS